MNKQCGGITAVMRLRSSAVSHTLLLLLVPFVLSGCARLSPVEAKAFHDTITAVDVGMRIQLDLISERIAEGQVERVLNKTTSKTARSLLESDFPPVLDATGEARIMDLVGVLQEYAELLRKVTDHSYRGEFATAVAGLNAQIEKSVQTVNGLKKDKLANDKLVAEIQRDLKLLSAVSSIAGEFAIESYVQGKAMQVVKKHDRAIQDFCRDLQMLVHPDSDVTSGAGAVGLVTLAQLAYRQSRNAFAQRYERGEPPPETDPDKLKAFGDEQRRLVLIYRENLQGERRSMLALAALRAAIGKIADAHGALAQDDEMGFWMAAGRAQDYLELATLALRLESKASQ